DVNVLSVFDKDAGTTQDRVSHFFRSVVWSQYETDLFLIFFDGYTAGNFRDRGDTFWCARFEEFLNTWQTLGNIIGRCDTTGVERTHRQLSTWLTNGLGRDNANGFSDPDAPGVERTPRCVSTWLTNGLGFDNANGSSDIDDLTGSHGSTVALGTGANRGITCQY